MCVASASLFSQPQALFYMTQSPPAIRSFVAHATKIDIGVPTVYSVDAEGLVWGSPDPQIMEVARRANVRVMPIIVNPGFKQDMIHGLLASPAARRRMIDALVSECRKYGYYGIQFDFENVSYLDRAGLVSLVAETSQALAPAGFKLSIAVVPRDSDYPGGSEATRLTYINWRGAYDLKRIAENVDFVSIMTYDQHGGSTPPGPVAGMPWVEDLLAYCLNQIPKEKVSLGIPLYGRRWYAGVRDGTTAAVTVVSINTDDALTLASSMRVEPQWDATEHVPWFYFYRDGRREYVFYNDARSFRDRYEMARAKGLHGFSAWVLGAEDPQIWQVLPSRAGSSPGGVPGGAGRTNG